MSSEERPEFLMATGLPGAVCLFESVPLLINWFQGRHRREGYPAVPYRHMRMAGLWAP